MPDRPALLDRIALLAALASPVFMLHGRGIGEVLISVVALAFLARSALAGDWGWLARGWVPLGVAWWGWISLCSLPVPALHLGEGGWHSFAQALLTARFYLFAAALEHRVLRAPAARRWLRRVLAACALYIALQTWLQFATGRNLYGVPRRPSGELTGPFGEARAGAPLSRLIFPTLLPLVARWLRGRPAWRLGAACLTVVTVATVVLIGQRMPLVLTLFGLVVTGLLLPRLRGVVAAALLLGVVLVGASAVVAPPTFYRLVTKFSHQLETFPSSDYGLIYGRALVIAEQHPWTGRGYDGFRTGCPLPRYFHGWAGGTGGGAAICNIHPHNHYLQALTDAGIPGLVLFSALILCWLGILFRGLWADPDPLRVGLFVAALIQEWPIASASSFYATEIGGVFFVLLGLGLAEARWGGQREGRQPKM